MRSRTWILTVMICISAILYVHPVFAQKSALKTADGKVDIELQEYTLDENGKEIPWKDIKWAMPGQRIVKIPRIKNLASPCEIRAKIEMSMGKDVEIPVTTDMLEGMPEEWEYKEDGYFYYKGELKKGEETELFRAFTIPASWDTRYDQMGNIEKYYTENRIDVFVTVEAIGDEKTVVGKTIQEKKKTDTPKTGDTKELFLPMMVCIFSALAFITARGWRFSYKNKKRRGGR